MKLVRIVGFILIVLFVNVSCGHKPIDNIYVDQKKIIHSKADCKKIYGQPTQQAELACLGDEFSKSCEKRLCKKCIRKSQRTEALSIVREWLKQVVYVGLCRTGLDFWGSEESFSESVSNEKDLDEINTWLKEKGYSLMDVIRFANGSMQRSIESTQKSQSYDVEWNEEYCKWIYFCFLEKGCIIGSYNDFMQDLADEEGFLHCFNRCREYGFTDDWHTFLLNIFKADCERCKEEHWEEWSQEIIDDLGIHDADPIEYVRHS